MAGHSQFKNIMYRKGAQDKKRAKLFGRLIREVTVAARNGLPDPEHNPALRAAISAALPRIRGAGKAAGLLNFNETGAKADFEAGFGFVAVAGDAFLLARETQRVAALFNS